MRLGQFLFLSLARSSSSRSPATKELRLTSHGIYHRQYGLHTSSIASLAGSIVLRNTVVPHTHNMAPPPPAATYTEAPPDAPNGANGTTKLPLEPGLSEHKARGEMVAFPSPPKFDDKYKERAYMKGRLAAAFRIFAKYGFDEGVAGHITLRVGLPPASCTLNPGLTAAN